MWVWAVQLKNESHPIRAKIAAENPPKQQGKQTGARSLFLPDLQSPAACILPWARMSR